jgi:hypothetical protein
MRLFEKSVLCFLRTEKLEGEIGDGTEMGPVKRRDDASAEGVSLGILGG